MITATQVLSAVDAAVAKKGVDHIYVRPPGARSHLYFHTDGPGCIIGAIINEIPELKAMFDEVCHGNLENSVNGVGLSSMLRFIGAYDAFSPLVYAVLVNAQAMNDARSRWDEIQRFMHQKLDLIADREKLMKYEVPRIEASVVGFGEEKPISKPFGSWVDNITADDFKIPATITIAEEKVEGVLTAA